MKPYFEEMASIGKPLSDSQRKNAKDNVEHIKQVEKDVEEAIEAVKNAGIPAEVIKKEAR